MKNQTTSGTNSAENAGFHGENLQENQIVDNFAKIFQLSKMSQQELHSYRLTSMEEPTDEMLHAVMEQVAESARRSTEKANAYIKERFDRISQL